MPSEQGAQLVMVSTGEASLESIDSISALPRAASGADSLHSRSGGRRSSSSSEGSKRSADISEEDKRLLNAKEEVQHDSSKSLTEAPKLADLLGWFSVACVIVNRMIGTEDTHDIGCTNRLIIHDV